MLADVYRVVKPGGFLQFSIIHPCFDALTLLTVASTHGAGLAYAIPVGDYFLDRRGETTVWLLGAAPPDAKAGLPKFRTLRFTRR